MFESVYFFLNNPVCAANLRVNIVYFSTKGLLLHYGTLSVHATVFVECTNSGVMLFASFSKKISIWYKHGN
jgi:hypothetical protein